jgi:MYXO-CTERM domain-containing protein
MLLPRRFVPFLPLLATPIALAASCAEPPPTPEAHVTYTRQNIMGGTEDPGDLNAVGIALIQGWTGGVCTGSLIAPNLVLTARHCVSSTPEQIDCSTANFGTPYAPSSFTITTDYKALESFMSSGYVPGTTYKVQKVVVPPKTKVCGNDVALLFLKGSGVPSSVVQPLIPRVDKIPAKGEEYRAVGFGATDDYGTGAGRRRQLTSLFVKCSGVCPAFYMDPATEWEGDHGICQGDSGGPAFDTLNRVIGVVSRGGMGCTTPIYGSVFGWADWIKQNAAEAADLGGYSPAPWVTGAPTGPDVDPGTGGSGGGGSGGSGGSPATGGAGGGTGTGAPGDFCNAPEMCQSQLCVYEDSLTTYCSVPCSADNPQCPANMTCATNVGACFLTGGFGTPCQAGSDCRSGICVNDGNGSQYCSQLCDPANPVCPNNASCAGNPGACYLPVTSPGSSSSGGCSVANVAATDPTKPIPWAVGLGLLGLLALRRRPNGTGLRAS